VPIAADAGFAGVGRYGRDPTRSSHGRQPTVKRVREVPRGAYARLLEGEAAARQAHEQAGKGRISKATVESHA
jgi:hypothetical protein